jgi:hypothetical protein
MLVKRSHSVVIAGLVPAISFGKALPI